jgi:hypothetical protein
MAVMEPPIKSLNCSENAVAVVAGVCLREELGITFESHCPEIATL